MREGISQESHDGRADNGDQVTLAETTSTRLDHGRGESHIADRLVATACPTPRLT